MGIVWLAEASGPGGFAKRVVIKELRRELATDPQYTAMFLEEARLAARLRHRNVVETLDVACDGGRWFMVLEWLEGASLHDAIPLLGPDRLPLGARVRILCGVLAALHHAHELRDAAGNALGVVHRDVSPRNVFLTLDGEVKLLDFGVAKCRDRAHETKHGVIKGSVAYMTPDHVAGASIDRRADVFAAGALLRELCTGERVWGDLPDVQILRRLIARDVPRFPTNASVPAGLRAIAERAMSPNRSDRYATAADMQAALERWLEGGSPAARGTLETAGAELGRALEQREPVEVSSSALVTDVSTQSRAPRWFSMAAAGAVGLAMLTASMAALLHDAVVVEPPAPPALALASPAVSATPLTVPPVVVSIAAPPSEPAGDAAAEPGSESAPEIPPNPYATAIEEER
jgi:serine/threonine protein kinase